MVLKFSRLILESHWQVTCALGFMCIAIFSWLRITQSAGKPTKNLPPGPKSWPVVGSIPTLLYLIFVKRMDTTTLVKHLVDTYGNIISVNIFGRITVLIGEFSTIKEAFQNPALSDRPDEFGDTSMRWHDTAKIHRRIIIGTLKGNFGLPIARIEEVLHKQCGHLLTTIESSNGKGANIQHAIRSASTGILLWLVTGMSEWDDGKIQAIVNDLDSDRAIFLNVVGRSFLPKYISRLFYSSTTKLLWPHVAKMIERRKAASNDITTMIDVYSEELQRRSSDPEFREIILRDGLQGLLRGGIDSVAVVITQLLIHIAKSPDVQERLHHEIVQIVGKDRLPCYSDRHQLHYTQATIMEFFRLRNPIIGTPHAANKTTTVNGFTIPEGANVFPIKCTADDKLWPDPEVFKPGRLLDDEGKFREKDINFSPFGTGRRSCMGEDVARMELVIFLAAIIQRFTIRLPDGVQEQRCIEIPDFIDFRGVNIIAISRED